MVCQHLYFSKYKGLKLPKNYLYKVQIHYTWQDEKLFCSNTVTNNKSQKHIFSLFPRLCGHPPPKSCWTATATAIIPCSHSRWKGHPRVSAAAFDIGLRCSQQAGPHHHPPNQICTTALRIRARVLKSSASLRWKWLPYPRHHTCWKNFPIAFS